MKGSNSYAHRNPYSLACFYYVLIVCSVYHVLNVHDMVRRGNGNREPNGKHTRTRERMDMRSFQTHRVRSRGANSS